MEESRFSSIYSLPASIEKTFSYLGSIAINPFIVEFDWKGKQHQKEFFPADNVPSFIRMLGFLHAIRYPTGNPL